MRPRMFLFCPTLFDRAFSVELSAVRLRLSGCHTSEITPVIAPVGVHRVNGRDAPEKVHWDKGRPLMVTGYTRSSRIVQKGKIQKLFNKPGFRAQPSKEVLHFSLGRYADHATFCARHQTPLCFNSNLLVVGILCKRMPDFREYFSACADAGFSTLRCIRASRTDRDMHRLI